MDPAGTIRPTETTTTAPVAAATTTPDGQVPEGQQTTQAPEIESKELGWTEEQKAYIKGLRDENAKYRTRSKERDSQVETLTDRLGKFETGLKTLFGGEDDKLTPEQRIEALQEHNQTLEVQSAMRDAAFEYGIGKESFEYFEFLVSKKLDALEEGEELSEEELDEIAKSAKSKSASFNTSVGTGTEGNPPPAITPGGVTLEQFSVMGIGDRSVLYQKNKALYESLSAQERTSKNKR